MTNASRLANFRRARRLNRHWTLESSATTTTPQHSSSTAHYDTRSTRQRQQRNNTNRHTHTNERREQLFHASRFKKSERRDNACARCCQPWPSAIIRTWDDGGRQTRIALPSLSPSSESYWSTAHSCRWRHSFGRERKWNERSPRFDVPSSAFRLFLLKKKATISLSFSQLKDWAWLTRASINIRSTFFCTIITIRNRIVSAYTRDHRRCCNAQQPEPFLYADDKRRDPSVRVWVCLYPNPTHFPFHFFFLTLHLPILQFPFRP